MPVPTIYYIRHGETAWNAEGRSRASQDIPLNELGRRQAAHAGDILADLLARDGRAGLACRSSQARSAARGRPWNWCAAR